MSDEELVKQINSVFDDYDDGLGEQGWTELRKKYPEKENKKLPIWWLTGIAATLLVVVGLYFSNAFDTEKVILRANHTPKESVLPNNSINRTESASTTAIDSIASEINPFLKNLQKQNSKSRNVSEDAKYDIAQSSPTNLVKEANPIILNSITEQLKPSNTIENSNTVIASTKSDEKVIANAGMETPKEVIEQPSKPKLSTEDFLKEQSKILANSETKSMKKNSSSTTTLDVFTGTFFNYHDDNEAKLSAGIGLNANIKVAKNLVLSLGAGISQNKVSYENKVPVEVSQAMFSSREGAMNMAPSNGVYSVTATNDVNFNGQLLSIDLPMVVKFFPSKKQDFYISTGINSSSYITQKYTYNYNWSNFGVKNGEAQPRQETEKSSLKGFDFANSAIIAIGINQNIGKNILIFEPYYKPALSTMGDKNLRISSAGLNLKFNFSGNSKK
ncbi:hypothetical protein [Pedobacter xixiisoli]|uniref:Outer membrane protein beta-barrel domain-containing protein n=1 Tax=Pedobacter xixiisoli TaxID=1476464 RepID=A0A285ZYF1_9SPHI|nr:hypothetical protein [Pedobacter xixiisoli]SOD14627.1 hypothetical protein SAMN06297358_1669 [Pedobacter xixiisoli]